MSNDTTTKPAPDLSDDATAARIGRDIAGVLGLHYAPGTDRYTTAWGTKTDAGLARTLERMLNGETA